MATELQSVASRSKAKPTHSRPELTLTEWAPATDREALSAVAELLRRFAPIIAIPDVSVPDCLLLNITGCGALFGGESALAEQLLYRLKQHNHNAHLVISDTVASAWAFAHPNGPEIAAAADHHSADEFQTPVIIVPPGQVESWFGHLPTSAARLLRSDTEILQQLGILTLRQLIQLPVEDLPSRLSDEAIVRIRQLTGVSEELLEPIPEAMPVAASWVNEFPVTGLKPLQLITEQLIGELCEQLRRRHVGTVRIDFRLRTEEGDCPELTVEVVRPTQDERLLRDVTYLKLDILRIPRGLVGVTATAVSVPLPIIRQRDLFATSSHLQPEEELTALINRLTGRLGRNGVLRVQAQATPVPEDQIQLTPLVGYQGDAAIQSRVEHLVTPEISVHESDWMPGRPLWLFREPREMQVDVSGKLNVVIDGTQQNVVYGTGPERIQTQWWNDEPVHRDYFRVQLQGGGHAWVFRHLRTGKWWHHGWFE